MQDTNFSYVKLRTIIGVMGVFFPTLLIVFTAVFNCGNQVFQPTISHYFYSKAHILFMWVLIVIGITLFVYKGNRQEEIASTIAAFLAWGVASFPTNRNGFAFEAFSNSYLNVDPEVTKLLNYVHYGFACLLFLVFAYFCFFLFQNTDEQVITLQEIKKKKRRNITYKVCGWIIVISIAIIGGLTIYDYLAEKNMRPSSWPYYTIIFETTTIMAFGFSWLIKGSNYWSQFKFKRLYHLFSFYR